MFASWIALMQCLGCEVFGRWRNDCVQLIPKLALERTRGLPVRIRRALALQLQRRWCGILGIALQKAVAHQVLHYSTGGADLYEVAAESPTFQTDLEVL